MSWTRVVCHGCVAVTVFVVLCLRSERERSQLKGWLWLVLCSCCCSPARRSAPTETSWSSMIGEKSRDQNLIYLQLIHISVINKQPKGSVYCRTGPTKQFSVSWIRHTDSLRQFVCWLTDETVHIPDYWSSGQTSMSPTGSFFVCLWWRGQSPLMNFAVKGAALAFTALHNRQSRKTNCKGMQGI